MATKAETEYMNRVADLGCICCNMLGFPDTPAELHHIRTGQGMGQRASNYEIIPLCPTHHRTGDYGTAYHKGSVAFEEEFGTELQLLEIVKEALNEGLDG